MRSNHTFVPVLALAVALAVGLVAGSVLADEGKDAGKQGEGGMQPPEKGEQHKEFAKMTGTWDAHMKFWMAPDQPSPVQHDVATCKLVLNGWFMQMDYAGKWDGNAWNGRLLAGYDQLRKEHIHVWMTDMGSEVSVSRGNKKDGVLHMYGDSKDWMTGKLRPTETTFTWKDADTVEMDMYWCTADKKRENQIMEIVYKRRAETR